MPRNEPLRRVDMALLSAHGAYLFLVFAWMVLAILMLAGVGSGQAVLRKIAFRGPQALALMQAAFFFVAAQRKPFRQRLMTSEATTNEALKAATVLVMAAAAYGWLLIE